MYIIFINDLIKNGENNRMEGQAYYGRTEHNMTSTLEEKEIGVTFDNTIH